MTGAIQGRLAAGAVEDEEAAAVVAADSPASITTHLRARSSSRQHAAAGMVPEGSVILTVRTTFARSRSIRARKNWVAHPSRPQSCLATRPRTLRTSNTALLTVLPTTTTMIVTARLRMRMAEDTRHPLLRATDRHRKEVAMEAHRRRMDMEGRHRRKDTADTARQHKGGRHRSSNQDTEGRLHRRGTEGRHRHRRGTEDQQRRRREGRHRRSRDTEGRHQVRTTGLHPDRVFRPAKTMARHLVKATALQQARSATADRRPLSTATLAHQATSSQHKVTHSPRNRTDRLHPSQTKIPDLVLTAIARRGRLHTRRRRSREEAMHHPRTHKEPRNHREGMRPRNPKEGMCPCNPNRNHNRGMAHIHPPIPNSYRRASLP